MQVLLITGIGGDIAQGVARIVRATRPDWRIVGIDTHDRHAGAVFADVVETVPAVTHASYLHNVEDVVRRHGVNVCLPMSEAELGFILAHSITHFWGAPLLGVAHRAIEVGLDKLTTARFLADLGIPTPWSVEASEHNSPPELPCIFKPRRSAGSKGVFICRDLAEARWHASRTANGIFQELLEPADREITCAVYGTANGEVRILSMLRQLTGGFTGWARVIDDADVSAQCEEVARALELKGAINLQLRLTAKGPRIFEINPRLSSTVYLRHIIGFQDVRWILDEYEGHPADYAPVPPGTTAVRIQDAAVLGRETA